MQARDLMTFFLNHRDPLTFIHSFIHSSIHSKNTFEHQPWPQKYLKNEWRKKECSIDLNSHFSLKIMIRKVTTKYMFLRGSLAV